MRKSKISIKDLLVLGLISFSINSNTMADAGQLLPGFSDENSLENNLDKYDASESYIQIVEDKKLSESESEGEEEEETSAHVPGARTKSVLEDPTENPYSISGYKTPGTYDNSTNFLEFKNRDIVKSYNNKAKTFAEFSYFYDTYDYTDSQNAYKATFQDSKKGHQIGYFHFAGGSYWSKGWVNTGWALSAGLGWSYGKGIFGTNGETSIVDFQLWTFPIDLMIALEIPVTRFMKLTVRGGPSAIGVLQVRSDREYGESEKQRRQAGYGYAGVGKLQFNLSAFSSSLGMEMYKTYKITDFFFNIEARVQEYSGFKEEGLGIAGNSIGAGFTFEYL